tara:strand:+ start:795 stop:1031 length:237 start_codon:yes stop_codon:yes gene_type:complete
MVTPTVSVVITTQQATTPDTLIKCKAMSLLKDQPKGCKNETSVKKPASSIKSIETMHTYASLISTVLEEFKDSKPKTN